MKNYYEKQARKLLKMTTDDAETQIKLIRRFNGDDAADKIVAEISKVLGGAV